jgi:hypothetical protein
MPFPFPDYVPCPPVPDFHRVLVVGTYRHQLVAVGGEPEGDQAPRAGAFRKAGHFSAGRRVPDAGVRLPTNLQKDSAKGCQIRCRLTIATERVLGKFDPESRPNVRKPLEPKP